MENIAKMINGRIHTAGCTLSCDYCCLAQVEHKNDRETYALKYPLETVLKACSKERLGGGERLLFRLSETERLWGHKMECR